MTQFEYIAIAYSMVQSFTALRGLSGMAHAIDGERRYWVHLTWLSSTLASILLTFWIFWGNRDIEWNFLSFTLALIPPGFLYVFVSLLVPETPSAITSWREHFYSVRVRLFATAIVWDLSLLVGSLITHGRLGSRSAYPIFAVLLAVHTTGAISRNPNVHAVLAPLIFAGVFIMGLTIFFET